MLIPPSTSHGFLFPHNEVAENLLKLLECMCIPAQFLQLEKLSCILVLNLVIYQLEYETRKNSPLSLQN